METTQDYDKAKGRFHHVRMAIANVVVICTAENDRWWRDPKTNERVERNTGELLMLMVSELAEAMEGHRKDLMDDKLPHRKMFEVELADCIIRICDTAGQMGLDLGGAVAEKLEYNSTRKDHANEARLAPGGKKY
jgi:NTP pyrophosphatase (non-canonical NTP hydrolase)